MVFGGWLPWLYTPAGTISGIRGAGLWVFYSALLALAGALLPPRFRSAAMIQGVLVAAVGIVLPVWQVWRVFALVGTAGWAPGPGLVMTFGGGVLCALAARDLFADRSQKSAAE